MKQKRVLIIIYVVTFLLSIPLIMMQVTNEVNWSVFDFLIAAILLFSAGLTIEFVIRRIKNLKYRVALSMAIFITLLIIWAELGVGILGTPLAGQ